MYTYPEKEKITVVNRYLNGETISQISRSTKISRTTIYLWIKERNNSFNKGNTPDFRYLHDLQEKCNRQQKIIEILQRSPCTPSAPLSKRYEVIKSLSDEYTVNILCEQKGVTTTTYCATKTETRKPQTERQKCFLLSNRYFTITTKFSEQ